ncbi:DUF1624 domain-containing protein [Rhodoferax aquaticus]|uniref:DUF1624 domain-containing protein n=1 Tax=Rhodoferax aquaticus TaxID=2527691 RepID=A0A515ELG2_9BURK|nr:heparan-alpha-glucosaminide N-acetyltransferase [Rhodoferax aquaticus]QDL53496.1 DUF1624 domain-containing protein [Rhodoferax aquaticus]
MPPQVSVLPDSAPAAYTARFEALDALRGLAVLWMTVFHFSFDLNHFGFTAQNFYEDPVWTVQRTCILSLFLFCAGAGQGIAVAQGQSWARFAKRWGQIALCAALVSAGSVLMFPNSWISFGVLHAMCVMLVLARLLAPTGRALWALGAVAMAAGLVGPWLHGTVPDLAWLDSRWWYWLGWVSHKPMTEDYVPIFPWLGVMLWGVAAAQWGLKHKLFDRLQTLEPPKLLGFVGRWSLTWYMVHQPILMGLLMGWVWVVR